MGKGARVVLWCALGLLIAIGVVLAIAWGRLHPSPPGLQVWRNGRVLTMDTEGTRATALVIEKDRVLFVGSDDDVARWVPNADVDFDLAGRTVVPGFIEAHGHFPGAGLGAVAADLNSPPIGAIENIDGGLAALRALDEARPGDGFLIGFGYDDTTLADQRHLTRADLDTVSTDRPVIAIHISGHMVAVNSVALERAGITKDSPDPPGGEIQRDSETGEPTGLLLETAGRPLMMEALDLPPLDQIAMVRRASALYAAQGYTTVQNGLATEAHMKGLWAASKIGLVLQRIVLWPEEALGLAATRGEIDLSAFSAERVHVGATKLVGDGSIQGYTGFLSAPYHDTGEHPADYRGYPNIDSDTLASHVKTLHCAGAQIAVHGNGDAAIDQFLDAWDGAKKSCPVSDSRPILVHAQMSRPDQLERMKELGVTPTFFSAHVYYWGDRHRDIFLGPERAARISPAASAAALGIPFTTHLDTPVVPIDSRMQLWAPVARRTSAGLPLGTEERISVEASLRAMTNVAAWQLRLEDQVGSIEPGKAADFVVLSDDPTAYDGDLQEIEVQRTVIGGVTVFDAAE